MAVPFEFTHDGEHYKRDAENVHTAQGWGGYQCKLTFKNGEALIYPYRLSIFQQLLKGKNYRRVGKSHFVYYPLLIGTRYPNKGILSTGECIPLYPKVYRELKKQLRKNKNRILILPYKGNFPSVNPN